MTFPRYCICQKVRCIRTSMGWRVSWPIDVVGDAGHQRRYGVTVATWEGALLLIGKLVDTKVGHEV